MLAALLVFFLLKEPVRGLNDGQRVSKTGVRGKNGLCAYFEDVLYLLRKLVNHLQPFTNLNTL